MSDDRERFYIGGIGDRIDDVLRGVDATNCGDPRMRETSCNMFGIGRCFYL